MSGIIQPLPYDPSQGDWTAWMEILSQTLSDQAATIAGIPPSVFTLAAAGAYSPTFQSGYIQYTGNQQTFAGNTNFIVGLALPNPSGIPGPALLLGSGGGNGTAVSTWIITDQAFDANTPGNNLGITAGETQGSGTQPGGLLWLIGGASFGGTGGTLQLQGGTSMNGPGGLAVLQGGNSTNGPAADAFVVGGENGTAGANVHLIMTLLNGVSGDVRIRVNSTILMQFLQHGEIFLTASGTGAGTVGQVLTSQGLGAPVEWTNLNGGLVSSSTRIQASIASGTYNDFNPGGGWPNCGILEMDTSGGNITLTGLAAGGAFQMVLITNIGANTLVLDSLNGGSLAANQFRSANNLSLAQNDSVIVTYVPVSAKWQFT
jgi:hypothetical protein